LQDRADLFILGDLNVLQRQQLDAQELGAVHAHGGFRFGLRWKVPTLGF
jgi:hypothetical protein